MYLLEGKLYLIGGVTGQQSYLKTVNIKDINGKFTQAAKMHVAKSCVGSGGIYNQLMVVGGRNRTSVLNGA